MIYNGQKGNKLSTIIHGQWIFRPNFFTTRWRDSNIFKAATMLYNRHHWLIKYCSVGTWNMKLKATKKKCHRYMSIQKSAEEIHENSAKLVRFINNNIIGNSRGNRIEANPAVTPIKSSEKPMRDYQQEITISEFRKMAKNLCRLLAETLNRYQIIKWTTCSLFQWEPFFGMNCRWYISLFWTEKRFPVFQSNPRLKGTMTPSSLD